MTSSPDGLSASPTEMQADLRGNAPKPPVLLLAFNRPQLTAEVLKPVVAAGIVRLYVAVDGPRRGHPGDPEAVESVLKMIDDLPPRITVDLLRREENLGCRRAVSSALDWFFHHEPEGVVLEDDCVPSLSFFSYCASLLEQYRDDHRVWMVTGLNQLDAWRSREGDYFFSDGGIWGWACWRDRWSQYDPKMRDWSSAAARDRVRSFVGPQWWSVLEQGLELTAAGALDTWDYQWTWTRLLHGGLSVLPAANLVTNIGTGADATHGGGDDCFVHTARYETRGELSAAGPVEMDREYLRRLSARVLTNQRRLRRRARVRHYAGRFGRRRATSE